MILLVVRYRNQIQILLMLNVETTFNKFQNVKQIRKENYGNNGWIKFKDTWAIWNCYGKMI